MFVCWLRREDDYHTQRKNRSTSLTSETIEFIDHCQSGMGIRGTFSVFRPESYTCSINKSNLSRCKAADTVTMGKPRPGYSLVLAASLISSGNKNKQISSFVPLLRQTTRICGQDAVKHSQSVTLVYNVNHINLSPLFILLKLPAPQIMRSKSGTRNWFRCG
jgi:hypothetical protein